jgi:hypothetical protein
MPKKTNEEIAYEIYEKGNWGNGDARRQNLANAGYDYDAVQGIVNQIASGTYQKGSGATASTNSAQTSSQTNGSGGNYNFSYYDTPSYISPYKDQISQLSTTIGGRNPESLGSYTSQYQGQIDDLLNQYNSRGQFSYDKNADPLYQMYEQTYTHNGQQAMKDTLGALAGINGGYASSYAQRAGQQAYDDYMAQLSAMVPELENRAYGRWQDEGNNILNSLGLYQNLDDTAYGRWSDDYNRYNDQTNNLMNLLDMYLDQDQLAYDRWRDAYGDFLDTYARNNPAGGSGGSGGSGRKSSGKDKDKPNTWAEVTARMPQVAPSPLDDLLARINAARQKASLNGGSGRNRTMQTK